MRYLFVFLATVFVGLSSMAQSKAVDTFTCLKDNGLVLSNIERNILKGTEIYAITQKSGSNQILAIFERLKLANGLSYFNISFPSIQMEFDYKKALGVQDIVKDLCKSNVFNEVGLDTFNTEKICIIKGTFTEEEKLGIKTRKDTITKDRSIVPIRSFTADVIVFEDKLMQDNVKIGTFEVDSVPGINGFLKQYIIYNAIGAKICNATLDKKNKQCILLTYKDGRFIDLSFNPEEDELKPILMYLIERKYM
jgi:hypothetical protein